eukprot:s1588_g3.t1
MNPDGQWKTAPAAHYPGPLCAFLANAIYKTWASSSSAALGKHPPDEAARSDTSKSKSSVQQQPSQVDSKAFTPHSLPGQDADEVKVYRPKIKEPSHDESEWSLSMDNYFKGTESKAQKILEEYFQEEEREGRMQLMSEKEAAKQYPGDALRIAAQGILDKPDGGHRIIHDGTHGVHLNNQIQSACRLENPGPRELSTIMRLSEEAKEKVIFGVNGDIAKAHRRVKVRRQDWGVQACRSAQGTGILWLNRTGTFGVASAAFWWSRLMGLLGRHALNLLSDEWFFVLVFVDDLHLASGGKDRWASIWKFIATLEMCGTPFSYRKFRGGGSVVGHDETLSGVSWEARIYVPGVTLGAPLAGTWICLVSSCGEDINGTSPELVARVCIFIRAKFKTGLRKVPCALGELHMGELFRTDAKCEDGRGVLGGWTIPRSGKPFQASWFSVEIGPKQAPWLFRGEEQASSWASASAELLASLVALKVFEFPKPALGDQSTTHVLKCGGGIDNKAASSLVQKRLSTK